MKNKIIILILLMATCVSAQMWGPRVNWKARWLRVRSINVMPGEFTVEVNGGVPDTELAVLGFETIGSGTFYNGYQAFTGDAGWDTETGKYQIVLMYPPSTITPEMVCGNDPRMFYHYYNFYCGCYDTPQSETVYTVDGFGYWRSTGWDPQNNFNFVGYYIAKLKAHRCMAQPCPVGSPGPMIPKNYICFADSTYEPLPDDAIPCGQSRIYILANVYACDSVYAVLSIPEHDEVRVRLERISQYSDIFMGSYLNSVSLGLKSFNQVTLEADAYPPPAANELIKADKMNVALPILVRPANRTINIAHDDMKFVDNITVGIKFINDDTYRLINPATLLDSIGYRLKTKWEARPTNSEEFPGFYTYIRRVPSDTTYRWCKTIGFDSLCQVTFKKDSLPVVGGDLTIETAGAFLPIENLPPHFKYDSDSITAFGSKIPRYHIKIDEDPSNAEFIAELATDRLRAIAWKEHAGGAPLYEPHGTVYDPFNNYWEDTTRVPCGNASSTAAGVMQLLRTTWKYQFMGLYDTLPIDSLDGQRFFCRWDSVAWNWKVNIHKGNYIYYKYLPKRYYKQQHTFPDSCPFSDCENLPSKKNKDDLKVYGYTKGMSLMQQIQEDSDWRDKVADADYVQEVRYYYYKRPWQ
jgi:hypothetical protein